MSIREEYSFFRAMGHPPLTAMRRVISHEIAQLVEDDELLPTEVRILGYLEQLRVRIEGHGQSNGELTAVRELYDQHRDCFTPEIARRFGYLSGRARVLESQSL